MCCLDACVKPYCSLLVSSRYLGELTTTCDCQIARKRTHKQAGTHHAQAHAFCRMECLLINKLCKSGKIKDVSKGKGKRNPHNRVKLLTKVACRKNQSTPSLRQVAFPRKCPHCATSNVEMQPYLKTSPFASNTKNSRSDQRWHGRLPKDI